MTKEAFDKIAAGLNEALAMVREGKVKLNGRDFDIHPYSKDEERVAEYLNGVAGIGGGNDPIGFIMASHRFLSDFRKGHLEREKDNEAILEREIKEVIKWKASSLAWETKYRDLEKQLNAKHGGNDD
jgi:hypothetical protein